MDWHGAVTACFVLLGAQALWSCDDDTECRAVDAGSDAGEIWQPPSDVPCECDEPGCGFCPAIEWASIPGGRVRVGCDEAFQDCRYHPTPPHEVTLSPYEIMTTEVTVRVYRACLEAGACLEDDVRRWDGGNFCSLGRSGFDDNPMDCVTWVGMRRVCRWLGGDLPTSAQWEHAARGEHDGLNGEYWIWPWGNDSCGCDCAVLYDDWAGCGMNSAWPVAGFPPTSFGLYDMIGNASEWVFDWRYASYEEWSLGDDPIGPPAGPSREKTVKGGLWYNDSQEADSSSEGDAFHTEYRDGGRCSRNVGE
jgi:formylglycine-generating enzyme required for sulfatase activity